MPGPQKQPTKKRQYPPLYEKIVPIAIGFIAVAILVLLIISVIVALGLLPGGA
ncbi:MAG: hypothetical protein JXA78_15090 [Anaerolineales bacterium]|nr:hypothetical protein [Anaerolineales bacterium]